VYLDSHRSYPVPAAAKKEFEKVENDLFLPPAALPKHVNRRQAGGAELQVFVFHCKPITESNVSLKLCQNAKILLKNSAKTYFRALFATMVAFCHETDSLISADQCRKLCSNSFLCVVFDLKYYKLFLWKNENPPLFRTVENYFVFQKFICLKNNFFACWLLIFLALRSELGKMQAIQKMPCMKARIPKVNQSNYCKLSFLQS